MGKVKHWLSNSDAIDLRSQGERYLDARGRYREAFNRFDEADSRLKEAQALKEEAEWQLWHSERVMLDSAFELTMLLRAKVPRYIKGGRVTWEDE